MQRHVGLLGARLMAPRQDFLCEVQARRRRRDRPGFTREDRLVAQPVFGRVRPMNVRRQRHVANLLQALIDVAFAMELDRAVPVQAPRKDFSLQALAEVDPFAHAHLASRMHERQPGFAVSGNRPQKEDLHLPAEVLMTLGVARADGKSSHAGAPAIQAGGEHARVVEHKTIARPEEARQLPELAVFPAAFPAVEHEHP